MENNHRLPVKVDAYQRQCFKGDTYTGFQCPESDPNCILTSADGLEIEDALGLIGGEMELDHHDTCRFSKTHATLSELVTVRCRECHTQRHANDASASRLKRSPRT